MSPPKRSPPLQSKLARLRDDLPVPAGLTARRAVLAWAVLLGLALPAYFLVLADVVPLAWDFHAYHAAAEAVIAGRPFVGVDPGIPGVRYVYPPPSVFLFVPGALLGGWQVAFLAQSVVTVAASLAVAALVVRTVERRRGSLPRVDRLAIAGFCAASAAAVAVLGLGQVDALCALAVAAAFVALERDRETVAGVALGAVALVKVFPVVLGLWLLARRAWRAVAAAVATGVAGLLVGAAAFGVGVYPRYLAVLGERSRVADYAGTVPPDFAAMSLYRPLSQLLPGVDPALYGPLAVALLAPPVLIVARSDRSLAGRLETLLAATAAVVVASPASNTLYVVYLYFPLLSLLYLDGRRPRPLLLAGTALLATPVQPAQVRAVLEATGVPGGVRLPVAGAVEAALTVASVPLVGVLLVVTGCVAGSLSRRSRESGSPRPVGAD